MTSINEMYYKWPSKEYDEKLDFICSKLKDAKNLFCIAHPNADGDALGSELGLYHFCKATNKRCLCLNFEPLSDQLSWLPDADKCVDNLPEDETFDLGFLMETTDAKRMGDRVEFFKRAKETVHLDHHVQVKGLGTINLIDDKASSTCEILYNVLEKMNVPLTRECREALYVGIMTDTGNFRYSNSTPRCHEIVAKLIEQGLDVDDIFKRVYENTGFLRVLMHGTGMARAKQYCDGKLVVSWLTKDDFVKMGASDVDADGFISKLSCIKGIEVALFFRETDDQGVKISFRSAGKIDVREISLQFGGGGHILAAGANINAPLSEAMPKVIEAVSKIILGRK